MKRAIVAMSVLFAAGAALTGLCLRNAGAQAAAAPAALNASPDSKLPPNDAGAVERLNKSPRHGEWIQITVPKRDKPMKSYIVHPERPDKAPVVIVIMEIFGMTDWVRGVTDQLAADGFIAIAPDFLSGKGAAGADPTPDQARGMVGQLKADEVIDDLNATRDYGIKLPSANGKSATVGFCWGGSKSFAYAIAQPDLNAAVVFYGTPPTVTPNQPDEMQLAKIKCPVAGFFGGNDQRVTSLAAPTLEVMKKINKSYDPHTYEGAGHGFMHQRSDADQKAAQQAWPLVIKFIKDNTK